MFARRDDETTARLRADKWLWAARFFKTRSLAADAVDGGKVKLAGERMKAARGLRVGDRLAITIGDVEWHVTVQALSDRRGPAEVARTLYSEDAAGREARLEAAEKRRSRWEPEPVAGGRPEKKQRRSLQWLRGY